MKTTGGIDALGLGGILPRMNHARWMAAVGAVLGLVLAGGAGQAWGQSDPGGLFAPWHKGQMTDGSASAAFLDAGHTKGADDDFRLSLYESAGRVRLTDAYRLNPTIGYSFRQLQMEETSAALPGQLTDAAVAFGTPIVQFKNAWFLALAGGAGYAGSAPFADADAWYARGTVILGKELGPDNTLVFGFDYNGNRTLYPDIPLPGVAYGIRLDPTLLASFGFPYSTLTWEPTENLRVEGYYTFPDLYEVKVGYNVVPAFQIFADFARNFTAYHDADYPGDRRLFFTQNRVEAGVQWRPKELLAVTAAVGYAFGQQFDAGFDSRDLTRVARVSDEPYLRLALEWRY